MDEIRFELLPGDLTICDICKEEYIYPAEDWPNDEYGKPSDPIGKCPNCINRLFRILTEFGGPDE